MPRVSVILPTYNREDTLRAALASVLAQDYRDLEVVVADDGSTDDTQAIVRSAAGDIRYLALEHSGLPARARNAGVAESTGDYVAFLDSDDEWVPGKLAQQVELLDREPSVDLVCSNAIVVAADGSRGERIHPEGRPRTTGSAYVDLLESNFVVTSTAVVRRRALEAVGEFSEEPILRGIEDYDLWLRLSANGDVRYLPEPLALYRRHGASVSNQLDMASYWRGLARVVQRAREAGDSDDPATHDALDRCSLNYLLSLRAVQRGEQPSESTSGNDRLKLHLGGGEVYLDGYVNIDVAPAARADLHADLAKLSFPAGSIEEIRVSNTFERFDRSTALRVLTDWRRWLRRAGLPAAAPSVSETRMQRWLGRMGLRPGGTLIIESPDFEREAHAVFDASRTREERARSLRHIFGSQERPSAVHADGWYAARYRSTLRALGFHRISIDRSERHGLATIAVTARKGKEVPREDLLQSAEEVLRRALVDDSETEQRLFGVWRKRLRDGTA